MHTDLSDEDYVENSQCDSGTDSHSEGAAAAVAEAVAHEFSTDNHIIIGDQVNVNCCDDNETSDTSKTMPIKRGRDHKHKNNSLKDCHKRKKQKKYARNTSYSAKLACCDLHEVKNFLKETRCTCGKECLQKFATYKSIACEEIFELRQSRFANRPVNARGTWNAKQNLLS